MLTFCVLCSSPKGLDCSVVHVSRERCLDSWVIIVMDEQFLQHLLQHDPAMFICTGDLSCFESGKVTGSLGHSRELVASRLPDTLLCALHVEIVESID